MTLLNRDHERCFRESIWRRERTWQALSLNVEGASVCPAKSEAHRKVRMSVVVVNNGKTEEIDAIFWFENLKGRNPLKDLSEKRGEVVLVLN